MFGQIDRLRDNLKKCSRFGISLDLDVRLEGEAADDDYKALGRGANNVLFGYLAWSSAPLR